MTARVIVSGTKSGEQLDIIRCRIQEELGRPGGAQVWISRSKPIESPSDWLSQPVTLSLHGEQGQVVRHYFGLISDCTTLEVSGHFFEYLLQIRPELWFCRHQVDSRTHQQKSVLEIIKQHIDDAGLANYDTTAMEQYEPLEYCAQYNESRLDYITRLMEQSGLYYYFDHKADACAMVVSDNNSCHRPLAGGSAFHYLPSGSEAYAVGQNSITHWQLTTFVVASTHTRRSFDYQKAPTPKEVTKVSSMPGVMNSEFYQYPSGAKRHTSLEPEANVSLSGQSLNHYYQGTTESPHLCCGYLFSLEKHPVEGFNQSYLITALEYEVENGEKRSHSTDSHISCTFHAVKEQQQFRLSSSVPVPYVHGPDTAIVVGPSGKEIFTDKLGRVKVQFHWDRRGKNNEASSCWVRVAQGWSGMGYGHISVPRIGEEVVVSFINGNPDFPIITGRVYNSQMTPPYSLPDEATISGWRSLSTPNSSGFNEFIFDDSAGNELVRLKCEKDLNIQTLNDRDENTEGNLTAKVIKDKKLTVEGDCQTKTSGSSTQEVIGELHISSKTKITLECSGSTITLGPEGISLKTGAMVKINGAIVKIN